MLWFWNEEVQVSVKKKKDYNQQKTGTSKYVTAYRKTKRMAKAGVAKAKNPEMDALCKKLDGSHVGQELRNTPDQGTA